MALSRADLVRAALDLLDEGGIDAVTVRAVATRLGVRAPALYWHVRNKQELLDEMGTEIQRRIVAATPVDAEHSWQDQLRSYGNAIRTEFLRHRDGARTFSGTRLTDPEVLRAQEPLLGAWTAQGLSLAFAVQAAELVTAFVTGFVIEEQERAQSDPARYDLSERDAAVGDDRPHVRAAGRILGRDPDDRFTTYLDVVVAGLETTVQRLS